MFEQDEEGLGEGKTLMEILADLVEATRENSRELNATRQVIRYWMEKLVDKEAPINVNIDISALKELEAKIEQTKQIALATRR